MWLAKILKQIKLKSKNYTTWRPSFWAFWRITHAYRTNGRFNISVLSSHIRFIGLYSRILVFCSLLEEFFFTRFLRNYEREPYTRAKYTWSVGCSCPEMRSDASRATGGQVMGQNVPKYGYKYDSPIMARKTQIEPWNLNLQVPFWQAFCLAGSWY